MQKKKRNSIIFREFLIYSIYFDRFNGFDCVD